jgi:hypothetical protein
LTVWLPTTAGTPCAPAAVALADQRHAPAALVVAGILRSTAVEEIAVDQVDDLQVPRQHAARSTTTGQTSSASGSSVWLV